MKNVTEWGITKKGLNKAKVLYATLFQGNNINDVLRLWLIYPQIQRYTGIVPYVSTRHAC